MTKIIYCQTVLFEEQVDSLKKLSSKTSIKDALIDAVEYYIEHKGELEYRGTVRVKPTVGNDHCIPRANVEKVESKW